MEAMSAFLHMEMKREGRAEHIVPEKAQLLGLPDGLVQMLDCQGIFGPAIDVSLVGSHGVGAEHHSLDDRVRISLEDGTIHEGAGISFVGVTDGIFLRPRRLATELPLESRGESAATPSAKARGLHFLEHVLGRHFLEGFRQSHVPIPSNVLLDVIRIDVAAVRQGDADLFAIEGYFLVVGYTLGRDRCLVEEPLHETPLVEVLLHDLRHIFRFHPAVERPFGIHHHDGPHLAHAMATRLHELDFPVHIPCGKFFLETSPNRTGTTGTTASATAKQHVTSCAVLRHRSPPSEVIPYAR
jgi:hypothetical protein